MKSDFDLLTFIKNQDKKTIIFFAALLMLALILIFFGGIDKAEAQRDEADELAELCSSISGVGECKVMISYRDGEVFAVAILCEGAESPKVRQKLTEFVCSMYGIGANRVTIQPLAKENKK